jgi:peroxiredoxin
MEGSMKLKLAIAVSLMGVSTQTHAALSPGDVVAPFTVEAVENGSAKQVELAALLQAGPVVLYFFPSAFTEDAETREFATNIQNFRAAGVTVLGMSRDSVASLTGLSTGAAQGRFALASADEALVNAFDVNDGAMFNTRTTYVIAPSGRIVFVHNDDEVRDHVKKTLIFVEGIKK